MRRTHRDACSRKGAVKLLKTSELEAKIRAWLDEQGYPLEMRVAQTFRRAGFRVFQSDYYRDPETEAFRELDVVASLDHDIGNLRLRIQFIIECKSSRSKPWLMFCSRDATLAPAARVAQRIGSKVASKALIRLSQRKEIQELRLFQMIDPLAYGATQAFTTGSDVVYSALTGVAAAVSARAREADDQRRFRNRFSIILFPVVVVEGRLFSCVLEDDATVAIAETQRGTLLWRNPLAGEPHTIVSILTDRAVSLSAAVKNLLRVSIYEETRARVAARFGMKDSAIPALEHLLKISYGDPLTPALLRLDPDFDLLRGDPRFQKLASGTSK